MHMNETFYEALYSDENFVSALGRMVLSSAKFESSIKQFIDSEGKVEVSSKSSLGGLLQKLVRNHTIDRTATEHFSFLLHQRNFFAHKLYENLSEYPSDMYEVRIFINRVNGVSEEMEFFSSLLNEHVEKNA